MISQNFTVCVGDVSIVIVVDVIVCIILGTVQILCCDLLYEYAYISGARHNYSANIDTLPLINIKVQCHALIMLILL